MKTAIDHSERCEERHQLISNSTNPAEVNARWESVVLHVAANALACCVVCVVVKVELVEAVGEGQQHQAVDEEELEDVQEHSTQRDLQGAQMGVCSEEADQAQGAEDVGDGKQSFRHQGGVPHLPVTSGFSSAVL